MADRQEYQVGQEVKVYQNHIRSAQDGVIVRIGRTLADILEAAC